VRFDHRQPKLKLRVAHKLDCFATLCVIIASPTFKSLYGNVIKHLKLPQTKKEFEMKIIWLISLLYWSLFEGFLGWFEAFGAIN